MSAPALERVAIVGMAGRFPGAADVDRLWELLRDGEEGITRFSDQELRAAGVPELLLRDPSYVKASGVLTEIERFDADLFDCREAEARILDPQQRLFLECSWEALEDAGYRPRHCPGVVGVYAGASLSTYLLFNLHHQLDATGADHNLANLAANDKDYLSALVAYKLDLRGPAVTVQTACSTSLFAVHLACQGLLGYEADMALAGGVTVRVPHRVGYLHQGGSMLAPDGHCRPFAAEAAGTVPGSGAGVVVLKRLSDALADGDAIRAVILGSAINNDGGGRLGFTAPSVDGQAQVIATALAVAGVSGETLSYVEAHGTATGLGDPIEFEALSRALRRHTERRQFCAVGSVKSNLGHLEAAAGVAGLIKTVLALEHCQIPPSLHFAAPSPRIDFASSPLRVNARLTAWPAGESPRRAGVSSFGFGGSNCHLVLEEAPAVAPAAAAGERPLHVLTLGARTAASLASLAGRWVIALDRRPQLDLADVCFTANTGRERFAHRLAVAAGSLAELRDRLASGLPEKSVHEAAGAGVASREAPKIAFLFTGQGSQYPGMGQALYRTQPVFRQALEGCADRLQPRLGRSILPLLFGEEDTTRPLDRTAFAQPALFALEYALAELWRSWGIEPAAVLGHGVGEVAAACVAGALDLDGALHLVAERGRLMERLAPGGGMMEALAEAAAPVRHGVPRVPLISNLTGRAAAPGEIDAGYWSRQCRLPVRFSQGIDSLAAMGCNVFLEIGPRATLAALGRSCLDGRGEWLASMRRGHDEWEQILGSLARLYTLGAAVDWGGFDAPYPRRRVHLPTYPFDRRRCWIEARPAATPPVSGSDGPELHPLLGRRLPSPLSQAQFESALSPAYPAYLRDHRIGGRAVMPASGYLEILLAAAAELLGGDSLELRNVEIDEPLVLEEGLPQTLQTIAAPEGEGGIRIEIFRRAEGERPGAGSWRRHAAGSASRRSSGPEPQPVAVDSLLAGCPAEVPVDGFYQQLHARGMQYEPAFRCLGSLWRGEGQSVGRVVLSPGLAPDRRYLLHPAQLDAALQAAGVTILEQGDTTFMPVGVDRLTLYERPGATLWSRATLHPKTGAAAAALATDLLLLGDSGRVLAEIAGLRSVHVSKGRRPAEPGEAASREWVHEIRWRPAPASAPSRREVPGTWIILADESGLGAGLAARLAAAGHRPVLVRHGRDGAREADGTHRLRPEVAADFSRLLEDVAAPPAPPLRGVVHLWALDAEPAERTDAATLGEDQALVLASALHLAQALLPRRRAAGFGLWLVTRRAQAVGAGPVAPVQALLWGFGRVLAAEHPELGSALVDLDESAGAAGSLYEELQGPDEERQVAYRSAVRYAARLFRLRDVPAAAAGLSLPGAQPYRLEAASPGVLESLRAVALSEPRPGPREVLIRVRASSLNFRDLLSILGLYPGETLALGGECAGEVLALGEGVSGLDVGQRVVALAPGSLASRVTARAELVAPLPERLGFEEAAALPIVFLTAHHALARLGRLAAGERVLIHAAAGGVGMAAVQLAQHIGAEIFATAGRPEKRELLRSLGVRQVFDSRSCEFAAQILDATGGRGVDVVLNSLAGEMIPASLSLLRPGGRFLEIGKTGIWEAQRVAASYPGVQYHTIAIDRQIEEDPETLGRQLREAMERFGCGEWSAIPVRSFPVTAAVAALRLMQQARHAGKLVLRHPPEGGETLIRPDATYLVTGGLGDLGLAAARHLAAGGAGALVLAGRRAPQPEHSAALSALVDAGTRVVVRQLDVADAGAVAALIAELRRDLPPLRGVLHAAGTLDDSAVAEHSFSRFPAVLAPKVAGTWNLHQATRDLPLDFFVLFSSVTAALGLLGSASYAAANSFLDAFAHHRGSLGLPASSVNWGRWQAGMTTRAGAADRRRMADLGMAEIPLRSGFALLERMLESGRAQLAVLPIDWERFVPRFGAGLRLRFFDEVLAAPGQPAAGAGEPGGEGLRSQLESLPADRRREALETFVRRQVARVIGVDGTIEAARPLQEAGLDSLMAVEVRNALAGAVGTRLPATLLFDYPTISALSEYLAASVFAWPVAAAPAGACAPGPGDDLSGASEEELDGLLEHELRAWKGQVKGGR
ncbi:MAG TPA: type I polyketide synthase [Thermoanaerobaculia bacterium]|nr:type I polyketide synthase [Thermoanaerobaculia bacterium]